MLYWLPTRRTRPDVPAYRDNCRRHTHADSDGRAKSDGDRNANSRCDDNTQPHRDSDGDAQCHRHAKCNGNPDSGTGSLYII